MTDWQQRVVDEKTELDAKIGRLAAFLDGDASRSLALFARDHLVEQRLAMSVYSLILAKRIESFAEIPKS